MAIFHHVIDGFVAEESAAFRVGDFSGVEKNYAVGFAGVEMQRAGLMRLAKHLNYAGKIEMREAAAQIGFGALQHLRGLEPILTA